MLLFYLMQDAGSRFDEEFLARTSVYFQNEMSRLWRGRKRGAFRLPCPCTERGYVSIMVK